MAEDTRSASPRLDVAPSTAPRGAAAFVALRSGLAIRHYVIEEVIGAGGFGITYRARHALLKSKVFALKEFFPRDYAARSGTHVVSTEDGDGIFRWGLDRFLKEAEALAKCEHPSIVDVVDYFEENGTAYAVLGYIEGYQLGQWLDGLGRPPTQAELDRILPPLLDALEVVHAGKMLHRDIAPDNILIRRDGSPCLIDFGACRDDIRERSRKVSAIVKTGYSPPEQYHGVAELQGPWTDIYAVGATLYRAVSGSSPMDSSRRGALGDTMIPIAEMAKGEFRPGFISAIDMALRLKPEERPQSIATWRQILLSDVSGAQATRPENQGQTRPPPSIGVIPETQAVGGTEDRVSSGKPTSKRSRAAILAAVAAIALAGAGALAIWRATLPSHGPVKMRDPSGQLKYAVVPPPVSKAEADADAAWRAIADTADSRVITQFLETHGKTQKAVEARRRLALLQVEAAQADAARAKAAAEKADAAEKSANNAWSGIRETRNPSEIEQFLVAHGASKIADTARARLTELRAALAAESQRTRDAVWSACATAPDASKVADCTKVIDGDDTPARRAAAFRIRGNGERASGNLDRAVADLTRTLELAPADAQALSDRGIAHYLKGDPASRKLALADYDAAIQANPNHAEALNNRAWAVFQAGRAADALTDANRSIEADPTNGYAYDTRGQIFEALGRREDAIRDFERAVQFDPSQEASNAALRRLKGTKK